MNNSLGRKCYNLKKVLIRASFYLIVFLLANTLVGQSTSSPSIDIESLYLDKSKALTTELLTDDLDALLQIRKYFFNKFQFDSVRVYDETISAVALTAGNANLHIKHYSLAFASDITMNKNTGDIIERNNYIRQFVNRSDVTHEVKANLYQRISNNELNNSNAIDGVQYAQLSVLHADSSGIANPKFHLRIGLVNAYIVNNQFLEAINTSLEAEQLALLTLNPAFASYRVSKQLGHIFQLIDDFDKAEEYYLKSLSIAKENDYKSFIPEIQYVLGSLYSRQGDFEKAELFAKKALEGVNGSKIKSLKDEVYSLLLFNATKQGADRQGKIYRDTLYQMMKVESASVNKLDLYITMANFNIRVGELDSAKSFIRKIEAFSTRIREKDDMNLSLVKYNLSVAENNSDLALQHHLEYIRKKDALESRNNELLVQRIEAENYREKQIVEIASLNQVNVAQDRALSIRNVAIIFGSIMLAILGMLLYGLYNLYVKNRLQTTQISKALADNQLLIKEIHHRVKNNLQVVSSLLNMQARKVSDSETKDALNSSKMRVQSMSIIHQNLYKGKELANVDMQVYMDELIKNISNTYSINDNVVIDVQVEKISLDVDTLVPLGLIANELICNSLKYAFPNDAKGNLLVKLVQRDNHIILQVKDDGVGLGGNSIPRKQSSLGARLIDSFVDRLEGEITIEGTDGTNISLTFPMDA